MSAPTATLAGLHIEGNLIASDLMADVLTADIKGQTSEAFGLQKTDKLADEIALAWGDAKVYWAAFQRALSRLPEHDLATTVTREQWAVPLLRSLGYDPIYVAKAEVVDEQTYAISHRAGIGSRESAVGNREDATPHSPLETPPIHITGCRTRLEQRPPSSTPRLSAHALVQDYLNRTEHLWAIATNGLRWRLLRDSSLMTRLTYVEFDLEQILNGENFAEFGLFYRLFHRSRLPQGMEDADECLLEFYHQESVQQGGRVRDRLRDGVEQALKVLGTGFLQHPDNEALRQRFRQGNRESAVGSSGNSDPDSPLPTPDSPPSAPLTETAYYRQLLLLIYRLLFLMVAESRNLIIGSRELAVGSRGQSDPDSPLPTPDSLAEKARIYREYYSIERLRALAEKASWRREGFQDQWQGLRVTFRLFDENWRGQVLGLSPLNGVLFGSHSLLDIDTYAIDNHDLTLAIRHLSLYEQRGQLRRVNYGALDVEELGSVYESLLDFHPQVAERQGIYEFQLVTGSDRKTTGSYYTPPELVGQLIKSALEPVIADRLSEVEKQFRESRVENRESGIGSRGARDGVLSGSSSVAGSHEPGRNELSGDEDISQGGDVRNDLADSQSSSLGTSKHRGGLRSGEPGAIHPISPNRPGLPQGTGNSSTPSNQSESDIQLRDLSSAAKMRNRGQNAQITDPSFTAEGSAEGNRESAVGSREKSDPHSLLPTPHSLQTAQEAALLSLKICDPACGSGHFLLAASRRIGKELARIRTGEPQPGPEPLRVAIRDVIQHCIYGVDLNPLAVDLCKVALWLEGLCRGVSLNFLDHRIKNGNSLVGVLDLDCLKEGIPDNAYKPVTGDDKSLATQFKKRNKQERESNEAGQLALMYDDTFERDREEYAKAWREIEGMKDDDPTAVRQKQEKYERSRHLYSWRRDKSACNLWTAAFFMPLTEQNLQLLPTSGVLDNLLKGNWATKEIVAAADRLADEKYFFHWPLEFPEVFEQGGFDCVLGNPPWERINLQEREFFSGRSPQIADTKNKASRSKLIRQLLQTDPSLAREWEDAKHHADARNKFIRESRRFPLTAVGDINTYAVFAETSRKLISPKGNSGIIVPIGIATDDTTKQFFGDLIETKSLDSLTGFENEAFIFPEVHHAFKFCTLVTNGSRKESTKTSFAFFCRRFTDANDLSRRFTLSSDEIKAINPNTLTCPIFRTRLDAALSQKIYSSFPIFENEAANINPWNITLLRMFHMSDDSEIFKEEPDDSNFVPLYEAKMFHQFDHRYSTYKNATQANLNAGILPQVSDEEKFNFSSLVVPRYWIDKKELEDWLSGKWDRRWFLSWREITSSTSERTGIFAILPKVAVGNKSPLILPGKYRQTCFLVANLNSLVFDFVLRQKIGGVSLSYFILKQIPVIPPERYSRADIDFITPRVLELTYTAWDLQPFAQDMGYHGDPFIWNPERRAHLRAELDAYYAHLYGLTRDELRYILDPADIHGPDFPSETFRVLKNNEMKQFGEYRTQRLVLAAWDKLGF